MDLNNLGRIPPQSIESEKAILGACMIDKDVVPYVFSQLSGTDFYKEHHCEVFESIKTLYQKQEPVDILTVSDTLKTRGTLECIGGIKFLTSLVDSVLTTANTKSHIEIVKRMAVARQIIKGSNSIIEMAYNCHFDNAIDLKAAAMQQLDIPITSVTDRRTKIKGVIVECISDIETQYQIKVDDKLFTGFSDLDKVIAGFHPEELSIIAARPGAGKTAFAIQIMLNLAKRNNHCLLVSREMSTLQIGKRILSNYSGVNGQKLRFCKSLNDEDWVNIVKAATYISDLPIEINDSLSTVQDIRAYCRELKNKQKLDVVFIDYLGLLRTLKKCSSRREEIEDISRQCKEISLEFRIPVIVLCQLNRANERDGREPKLIDLRESGAIEQDADNVIFLHVPKDTDESEPQFDIKVIISKQRNGPTGYIYLRYYRSTFRFYGKC